jgi:hypothetical protein
MRDTRVETGWHQDDRQEMRDERRDGDEPTSSAAHYHPCELLKLDAARSVGVHHLEEGVDGGHSRWLLVLELLDKQVAQLTHLPYRARREFDEMRWQCVSAAYQQRGAWRLGVRTSSGEAFVTPRSRNATPLAARSSKRSFSACTAAASLSRSFCACCRASCAGVSSSVLPIRMKPAVRCSNP